MPITRVHIEGYKRFKKFDLDLNPTFNVIVGDNETGKSSLLEAIGLVLTGRYDGHLVQYAIDPYLFNAGIVANYFAARRSGKQCCPPHILIEAYFQSDGSDPAVLALKGQNNSKRENCPGLVLEISVGSEYTEALKEYAADSSNPDVLPVEYYRSTWRGFNGNSVSIRKRPIRTTTIDTSHAPVYQGPKRYIAQELHDRLTEAQWRGLSLAYKRLHQSFMDEPDVIGINADLSQQDDLPTDKKLSIQMDLSSRSSWDNAIAAHIDNLPFGCAGKGEQCRFQMRLAIAGAECSQVLLFEEPENHLSHSSLNRLMEDIRTRCEDRQVVVATHSAFVLNKLGIDKLRLLSLETEKAATLSELSPDTRDYFMRLPGYDTLRLVLAKRSILVEGPSDELIVQRAYQMTHGKLPLAYGVDVISVRSLAFLRFLEIAKLLGLEVRVVTDNDGDVEALEQKYEDYREGKAPSVRIYYDPDPSCKTLEPQLLRANSRDRLNTILERTDQTDCELLKYMRTHKTDCALKLFETKVPWEPPEYIKRAIERE